jgi:cyclopropane fatty-acyl-phospholipid synthase-like methyltransferase
MEPKTEDLTNQTYWEDTWRRKDPRPWADLGWVQDRYNWFAWDHLLRARLRPQNGRRFLEVGCAGGKWLIYFHKTFGYSVTGCDYSETGCAMARRNVEAAGIDGTILQQDLFTLTGEFDVIYSHGLIEHFNDPKGVLEKFVSLLHPSPGTLISIVPNLTGLSGFYNRLLKPETFTTHRVITLDELRGWYEEIGLHHIEGGALGSFVPFMFPRDKIRREHPQFYRLFWGACLGPLTWAANRLCIWLFRRVGVRIESPRFSPYLYAIGEKRG